MQSGEREEMARVDFDEWHALRLGEKAQIVAKITGRARSTLILENSNWDQQVAENPLSIAQDADPRQYMTVTFMRTEDGMTALAAEPIGEPVR